jgi:hypothetical protein
VGRALGGRAAAGAVAPLASREARQTAAAAPSAVWSDSALDPVESSQRAMLEAKARYERRLPSG